MSRTLFGGLLAAALLFLFAASSAVAAPSWLPPSGLSSSGFGSVGPNIGFDASGEAVATWFGGEASTGDRVQAATRPRGGNWSPPATLSGDGAFNPSLAVAADGSAVVAWELESLTEGSVIEAAVREGGVWASSVRLPKGTELHGAYFPRVAVNNAGDALAVWQQCYSSDSKACFERHGEYVVRGSWRPAGGSWSAPVTLSKGAEDGVKLTPAVDVAGDLAVAWEDHKGAAIHVALLRAGAASWSTQQLSVTGTASGSPEVGLAADGTGIAVWDSFVGGNYRAESSIVAPGSTAWSAPGFVSEPGVNAFQPRLALAPNGEAVAVWETIGGNLVQAAVRSGSVWQPVRNLSGEAAAEPHPSVAINSAGAMLAVWRGGPSSSGLIQGNARPPGGDWLGATNVPGSPGATEPAVAVDPEGDGAAVWRDSSESIQAAGFDAAGPRLDGVSIPSTGNVGQPVRFAAAASDGWSGVANTTWSFGDGASGAGGTVMHAFSKPGTYKVTVTSGDAVGNTSNAVGTIVVSGSTVGGQTTGLHLKNKKGVATIAGVARVRHGTALLRMRCGALVTCAGLVKLARHGKVLGKAAFRVPAQKSRTIPVRLSLSARRALSSARPHLMTVHAMGRSVKPRKLILKS